MKLYTTTGDKGETSLADGTRVPKNHPRVIASGDLDELNAVLGWCRSAAHGEMLATRIETIQRELFCLGSELASPVDGEPTHRGPGPQPEKGRGKESPAKLAQKTKNSTCAAQRSRGPQPKKHRNVGMPENLAEKTRNSTCAAQRGTTIRGEHCRRLEAWIDEASEAVPVVEDFVLPGGAELASRLHVARTRCRAAERSAVAVGQSAGLRREVIVYLNRLSDLLFAWARQANHEAGCPEVIPVPPK